VTLCAVCVRKHTHRAKIFRTGPILRRIAIVYLRFPLTAQSCAPTGDTTMSPFCLIDVASIRDHAHHPHEHDVTWHARLAAWIGRLFRRNHI
jgi:hypothetical protein